MIRRTAKLFLINIFFLSLFFACSQEINENTENIINNFNNYDVANDSLFKLEEINIGAKLENPWAIQFINDNEIIVTEKRGNLIYANLNKNIHHIINHEIPLVQYGQGGLLDIKFHKDREGGRYLHNYPNGNYEIGRHITYHNFENTNELFIVWFGYYPLNDNLIQRKLQIKDNIPITDRNPRPGFPMGFAWQHFFSKNKLLEINNSKSKSGLLLKNINMPLFDIIHRYTIDLSCKSPYQKTYLSNFYK